MDFETPLDGWFTHLAWNVDLRLAGPFVRPSQRRRDHLDRLAGLAGRLTGQEGVVTAHALEVTVIPPLKGGPRYDLALLVHADEPMGQTLAGQAAGLGLPAPELALTAQNSGKLGDTEGRSGEILLNHFAGTAATQDAVEAWKTVSEWYTRVLGVDNSTLLEFTGPGAPFLIMNYARIPGRVVPFLAGQLLRPSFHRVVRRELSATGITPFPLFARKLEA